MKGLGRIYLATWPYLFAQLGHFLALLGLNLLLLGFGTAVGFLGIDVLMDSVGRAEPLSAMQAAVMLLPEAGYVGVEALSESARLEVLFRFLIVSAVILVATTSAFTLLAMYKVWILQRVNQGLRVTMVRNAEDLSLRFHARMPAGDGIYRVFQDSAMVTAVIDHVVVQPVISIAMMALQIAVATLFSPYFAVLMLFASVVVLALALVVTPRLRTWSQAARRANAELFTRVQETFQGIQAIKAYGFEDANLARFRDESTKALDTAFALRRDFAALKVVVSYLLALLLFATDYLATRFVLAEGAVFGASLLVLFGMSVTQWTVAVHEARRSRIGAFALHFEELVRVWCYAQDMAVGLGRAFWLLAQQPEVSDPAEPVAFPAVREGVRFHGVGFGYAADTPVLRGFNFAARPGEVTALVGASGAGKSTAMALLLRLFDPDEGSVAIDGVDLRSVLRADLREHVAIALQENVLFPTSIADNLRYASPAATDDEIREAAEVAFAAEFIEALPDGFETVLGVGGALLSTGQKQRLSIARALVRGAPVLVLDEPTASLDAATERQVFANLRAWAQGRVVIVITHRLSTIRTADRIAVLADGGVVESGSHDALMARRGPYRDLVAANERPRG
ncbi:MAG: ABC transporter ATP-binding protein [Gammaproteobacteria bacterium]|nr:ABC transporter ATP-binding protein [Gammaproteobacteria bacterium]